MTPENPEGEADAMTTGVLDPVRDEVVVRNPATDRELARVPATPAEEVAGRVALAREAQALWETTDWPGRRAAIDRLRRAIAAEADAWAEAITLEVGKPRLEAASEVLATLDALRWLVHHGRAALADGRLAAGWQRWMGLRAGRLRWAPYGVVGKLGTWNYPLFLNAPAIAAAAFAGNGVVWKPSESATLVGLRFHEAFDAIGLPPGLVSTVCGGPDVGRALIEAPIDLGMFTGGIGGGRAVMAALAARGVPTIAELSGFDPAIVLPDAPPDPTADALTWSAFVGAGQTCVAVKRVYVVGEGEARRWAEALAGRARGLRAGDPAAGEVDLGPLISAAARDRFHRTIVAAADAGAEVLAGGEAPEGPGAFYRPTVLLAEDAGPEAALCGCFGPVVVVRGVAGDDEAIAAANATEYGLAASVWGRDLTRARAIAGRLRAGMVGVNEAVLPTAHATSPFGGVKASGVGRVHGAIGLRAFAQPQVVHARGPGGFRPHLFPYDFRRLAAMLRVYRRLFHPGG